MAKKKNGLFMKPETRSAGPRHSRNRVAGPAAPKASGHPNATGRRSPWQEHWVPRRTKDSRNPGTRPPWPVKLEELEETKKKRHRKTQLLYFVDNVDVMLPNFSEHRKNGRGPSEMSQTSAQIAGWSKSLQQVPKTSEIPAFTGPQGLQWTCWSKDLLNLLVQRDIPKKQLWKLQNSHPKMNSKNPSVLHLLFLKQLCFNQVLLKNSWTALTSCFNQDESKTTSWSSHGRRSSSKANLSKLSLPSQTPQGQEDEKTAL